MREDLLLRLAAGLEADAANPTGVKFDLGHWAGPSDEHDALYSLMPEDEKVEVSCGTTACAMGFAAISGMFKDEGLTYEFSPWRYGENKLMCLPAFKGATGFDAAEKLFEISDDDAEYLFNPDSYRGVPKAAEGELLVASRIREFVDGNIDERCHPGYDHDWADDEDVDEDED